LGKNILVTGGAGFIGSHLCEALLGEEHRIVIIDNFCSGHRRNVSLLEDRITLIDGDIRVIAEHHTRIGPIDTIIHLAAMISGYDSLSSPDEYNDVNIRGLLRVIEFAAAQKVRRIVFASSSTVYGNQSGTDLSELVLPKPLTVYALTKLAGEHLLDLYGRIHGFSHCSLRLFNVYGPRQATDHPYANVTCKFSHSTAHRLPVCLYGDGEQSRDFVYVHDVVRAFLAVLEGSEQTIYNVGTSKARTINDLLVALAEIGGAPLETIALPPWVNDIRSIRANISRFTAEFGFSPVVALEQGLADTVAYFREHPEA